MLQVSSPAGPGVHTGLMSISNDMQALSASQEMPGWCQAEAGPRARLEDKRHEAARAAAAAGRRPRLRGDVRGRAEQAACRPERADKEQRGRIAAPPAGPAARGVTLWRAMCVRPHEGRSSAAFAAPGLRALAARLLAHLAVHPRIGIAGGRPKTTCCRATA